MLFREGMLVFSCCITNYHKFIDKQTTYAYHVSLGQESWHSLGSPKAMVTVSCGSQLALGVCFQDHSGCWKNSVPWGFKTEAPFSCWLSAKTTLTFCRLPSEPCHVAISIAAHSMAVIFFKASKCFSFSCWGGLLNSLGAGGDSITQGVTIPRIHSPTYAQGEWIIHRGQVQPS